MIARQLPTTDYLAIKAATRELIAVCGGQAKAASFTRVSHTDLSRYGSVVEEHADRFMPADVMADLEAQCGQPILTRELARLSDFLLVEVPGVSGSGAMLGVVTARAMKETSDVFVAIADGLGDGKLCAKDVERIEREIDEALTKLATLKLQVQAEEASE